MDDAISRQAAIDAIDECYCGGEDSCGEPWIYKENAVEAIQMIEPMPPAQPKRGKWIDDGDPLMLKCGNCGYGVMRYNATHFCPNCGQKKEVEHDG